MKVCFKCGLRKPLDKFYKHKKMTDGHLSKCIICTKKDVLEHRAANIDKIREYDRNRGKSPHRIKRSTEVTKRMRKDLPHVYKAHNALNNAVRDGKVIKPTHCSTCNKEKKLHGHHDDYSKPLDVEWMCAICHRAFHRDLDNP